MFSGICTYHSICFLNLQQDLLEYKNRNRMLKIKFMDGTVKTLQVRENLVVSAKSFCAVFVMVISALTVYM